MSNHMHSRGPFNRIYELYLDCCLAGKLERRYWRPSQLPVHSAMEDSKVLEFSFHTKMGISRLVCCKSTSSGGNRLILVVAALLCLLAAGQVELQTAAGINISSGLCDTLVRPWGYPCNEYTVQTDDGFLLGVQNIPNGISKLSGGAPRPPVFLQHGIFAGGDNWVFNNPQESLGFILADAGYDVWIGNIRGSIWSHGNVNLATSDAEFWDWSWDQLAAYDMPAMLQFVYNQTGSKIMFIGHSQATTLLMAGLVGTAQSQALTNMLTGAVLICPIAYMNNISSSFDKTAAELYVDVVFSVFGIEEFNLYNQLGISLVQAVCGTWGVNCTSLYRAVAGYDCCRNDTRVPFYLNFFPQPTSSKNLGHFAQMIRRNTFSKYDYGFIGNLQHYEQLTAPVYNLAKLPSSVPFMIVAGGQDSLADPSNVQQLVTFLGPKVEKFLSVERYAHGDFLVSTTANVEVYPEIMSFLHNLSA